MNQVLTFIGVSQNLALAWPQTIYNQVIGQGYAYENCFSSSTISYTVIQIFEGGKKRKKGKWVLCEMFKIRLSSGLFARLGRARVVLAFPD